MMRGMRRAVPMCLILLWLATPSPLFAQTWQEEVNNVIDRGVERLVRLQKEDGSFTLAWPDYGYRREYPMGPTSLIVYALVKSGLPPDDPAIRKAVEYLRYLPFKKVYSVGLLIMALDALGGNENDAWIQGAAKWLEDNINPKFDYWGYPKGTPDLSNTQYAVLGLWTAERHGYKVRRRTWIELAKGVMKEQVKNGGFRYRFNYENYSTGSMTTAGITCLAIALERLKGAAPSREIRASLERAWDYLDRVFTATGNPVRDDGHLQSIANQLGTHYRHLYYLYGLERVAALAKRKKIGGRDWYREGAIFLLGHEDFLQRGKKNPKSFTGDFGGALNTAFALLFLRRATFSGLAGLHNVSGRLRAPVWRYTTAKPDSTWHEKGFDDSSWEEGASAFGPYHSDRVAVRSLWPNGAADIWARRTFSWNDSPKAFGLFVCHDDGVEIWINGIRAVKTDSWTTSYKEYAVPEAARQSLKPDGNLIAVHGHDIGGARALDVRFIDIGARTRHAQASPSERWRWWWRFSPSPQTPHLRRFLILDPLAVESSAALLEPLDLVARQPSPGATWRRKKWKARRSLEPLVNLAELHPRARGVLHHATTWIDAGPKRRSAVLHLTTQGAFRVFLDDTCLLSHNSEKPGALFEFWRIPLLLRPGKHLLTIRILRQGGPAGFTARVSGRDGLPIEGLRTFLDPDQPDDELAAIAQPDHFSWPELLKRLHPDAKKDLNFKKADFDERVIVSGLSWNHAARIAVTKGSSASPAPPPGARGVIALGPDFAGPPARLYRRLDPVGAKSQLRVRYAGGTGDKAVPSPWRIIVFDGQARTLHEETLPPAKLNAKAWKDLSLDLSSYAGKSILVVLEVDPPRKKNDRPVVFVDRIQLK